MCDKADKRQNLSQLQIIVTSQSSRAGSVGDHICLVIKHGRKECCGVSLEKSLLLEPIELKMVSAAEEVCYNLKVCLHLPVVKGIS